MVQFLSDHVKIATLLEVNPDCAPIPKCGNVKTADVASTVSGKLHNRLSPARVWDFKNGSVGQTGQLVEFNQTMVGLFIYIFCFLCGRKCCKREVKFMVIWSVP